MELKEIKALEVYGKKSVYFGGSQSWYMDNWMRMSGCAPTAASNIVWYLSRTRSGLKSLSGAKDYSQEACRELMTRMFSYVEPGRGGVRKPSVFTAGLTRYAKERSFAAQSDIYYIPSHFKGRPSYAEGEHFLQEALRRDLPVAFLNYSAGDQKQIEAWHWVTIMAYRPKEAKAVISDLGIKKEISLKQWWETSFWGGALAWVDVQ